jgi:hypothetical protein
MKLFTEESIRSGGLRLLMAQRKNDVHDDRMTQIGSPLCYIVSLGLWTHDLR